MHQRLNVQSLEISGLRPDPRNARTHSRAQVKQIAASIEEFGFVNPVLVDETDRVIAGHGRLEAARLLGLDEVSVIRLSHLTAAQKRALALADNKIAANAGWDVEILAQELHALCEAEVDFDVSITGFTTAEIDLHIESLNEVGADPAADHLPEPTPPEDVVVVHGDRWLLGRHRLVCGDATEATDIERLMAGERAEMVFVDPPYNVPIDGHACGSGRIRHRPFVMASGEMREAEFTAFLERSFANLSANSVDGSIHFVCMDWRHMQEILTAGRVVYDEFKNLIVWAKPNGGMGSFYRSRRELIFVFKKGAAPHINNFELGQHGRHRTNVWEYAGVNSFREGRLDELAMHPTVKPVALISPLIKWLFPALTPR